MAHLKRFPLFHIRFLQDIKEDVQRVGSFIQTSHESFEQELYDLKLLVGNRTSVPKEQVYPKFDSIATNWLALMGQRRVLQARKRGLEILRKYRSSFQPTLGPEQVRATRSMGECSAY